VVAKLNATFSATPSSEAITVSYKVLAPCTGYIYCKLFIALKEENLWQIRILNLMSLLNTEQKTIQHKTLFTTNRTCRGKRNNSEHHYCTCRLMR
jgi:hypothetical protein